MPELPEVEVTRLGIAPHLVGQKVSAVKVLDGRLRWPVPSNLPKILSGQKLGSITRRGKYLLLQMDTGYLLIHLGMTGTLRILPSTDSLKPHDRVTFESFRADEEDEKALIDIGVDLIDKENSLRREREKAPFGSKLRQSENKCVNDGGKKKLFYKKTLSSVLLSFTQPPARRLP